MMIIGLSDTKVGHLFGKEVARHTTPLDDEQIIIRAEEGGSSSRGRKHRRCRGAFPERGECFIGRL